MDESMREKEQEKFLERMSHEIRTPMNSIIGLAYLTSENVDNTKQVLENMEKINLSAHFLLSFMDDILNLSQLQSGNVALIEENVLLDNFFEKLGGELAEKARMKSVCFFMEKKGNFAQKCYFDEEKLHKALYNILENAVKFTPAEGKVDFTIEMAQETDTEVSLRMEVSDNGIGMEENFLPHVFEPFEQEDNGNTTLNGGTGLGLPIAKNIIEFMGGQIDVYSRKDKGSSVVVVIALKKVSEDILYEHGSKPEEVYDFTGKRALLVEDNEINIEITKNILLHKKLAVEVAYNGREGVAAYMGHEEGYYDVILMDIRMPVMDGLTAARQIRSAGRADSGQIPIIAMTAKVFEEDVRQSFEAGMDAHLSKPLDIQQMYHVLKCMIERNSQS